MVIKRNFLILLKPYWGRQKCCLIIVTQSLLRLHLICILLIRLRTSVQSFHCLRVHYRRTHLGRWIPLCLLVQTYLTGFTMITSEELTMIVSVMKKTTCSSDPFPSKLLMSHLPTIIDTIMHIINLCFIY